MLNDRMPPQGYWLENYNFPQLDLTIAGPTFDSKSVSKKYSFSQVMLSTHTSQSFFSAPSMELKVTNACKLQMGPSQRKSTNILLQCMGPYL